VDEVQRRIGELLGKPAALVPKGVIAQQAALRGRTEPTGRSGVALHPLSHFDGDESSAYERCTAFTRFASASCIPSRSNISMLPERPGW